MTDASFDQLAAALVGRYTIDRQLGAGGMATVYLAHDVRHDRDVAIKVVHPDLGAALGGERFLAEIKTTAKLQHPHILPLLDSGEADGLLFYVMPLVTGETLRTRLQREQQLPIVDAVRIAREVASALDYAHRQGVVHRDIKPENILLHEGQALVADFGISLAVQTAGGSRLTQTGLSLGTPQYMSPEQAMGERAINARADIYALGAVTYEMLAGEPPFSGPTVQAIVAKVMSERPVPLGTVRDTVPAAVEEAVSTALAKLPADRFASAAEFAAALSSTSATSGTRATARATSTPHSPQASRRTTWLLTAVTAVALIAAAWSWLRPVPRPHTVRFTIELDSTEAIASNVAPRIALSPDGTRLVTSKSGRPLMIRDLADQSALPIPGTENGLSPAFSPDGSMVAFIVAGTLKVTTLSGGPTTIGDGYVGQRALSWGDDGYLYAARTNRIVRVRPAAGATPEYVTTIDAKRPAFTHFDPVLLPDRRHLLFMARVATRDEIRIEDLQTHEQRTIGPGSRPHYSPTGHLVFYSSEGSLMMVPFDLKTLTMTGAPTTVATNVSSPGFTGATSTIAMSRDGSRLVYAVTMVSKDRELTWVTREGVASPAFPGWKARFDGPVLSPDGARVAVSDGDTQQSILWVAAFGGGQPNQLLTSGRNVARYPAWMPSGRELSFYSDSTAESVTSYIIWHMPYDGSAPPAPVSAETRDFTESAWSRDGQWFVGRTYLVLEGSGDIYAIHLTGDQKRQKVIATAAAEYSPTLSPDGQWMSYVSNEANGQQVYVLHFPDAVTKYRVSDDGGTEPRWSRDGKEIFYRDNKGRMVAAQVHTTPTFGVDRTIPLFSDLEYFRDVSNAHPMYDVTADGRRFLMVRSLSGNGGQDRVRVIEHLFDGVGAGKP